MSRSEGLRLTFLGVRGSRPTPVGSHLGFGGNTSCLELRSGGNTRVFIDAGTGLVGADVGAPDQPFRILLTHFHSDHIHGLPFFPPLFSKASRLEFWTGHPAAVARGFIDQQLSAPFSPALEFAASTRSYHQLTSQPFELGDLTIRPFALHHPQGAWGFRIDSAEGSIVHASDHEHGHPEVDAELQRQAQGADVLIYDAQYTDDEYAAKRGWGHSTWREATRIARDCGVKRLILFHHDPTHDDRTMTAIETEAQQLFAHTEAAREGRTLRL